MTYQITEGTSKEQRCTASKPVWVYNADCRTHWHLTIELPSKSRTGVHHKIYGSIRKYILPSLTYGLSIFTTDDTVKPIERMYFDSVDAAADHAQTYIQKVVNGGAQ